MNSSSVSADALRKGTAPSRASHRPRQGKGPSSTAGRSTTDSRSAASSRSSGEEEEEAALLREVNQLMQCHWDQQARISNILQCTSSFFVLLYQRMFEPLMPSNNAFSSPNTQEQKLHNMEMLLIKLQQRHYDVSRISAAKVAQQDKSHIRQLIHLFVTIHREMQEQSDAITHGRGAVYSHQAGSFTSPHSLVPVIDPADGSVPEQLYRLPGRDHPHGHHTPVMVRGGRYPGRPYTIAEVPPHRHSLHTRREVTGRWSNDSRSENESPSGYKELTHEDQSSDEPREVYVDRWRSEVPGCLEPLPEVSLHDEPSWQRRTADDAAQHPEEIATATGITSSKQKEKNAVTKAAPHSNDVKPPKRRPKLMTSRGYHSQADTVLIRGSAPPSQLHHRDLRLGRPKKERVSRHSKRPLTPVKEPALSPAEQRLLASHPFRRIDHAARDEKIERIRANRFLGEMQARLRQRLRQDYDRRMDDMRKSLRAAAEQSHRDKVEAKQELREYSRRYREAYAALVEAAASEKGAVPQHMMAPHTATLAAYYNKSLRETRMLWERLIEEEKMKERDELHRYAVTSLSWQKCVEGEVP